MPDNFSLSPLLLFHTISHFLCCLFSGQCVIQLPFLSKCVEEIPALNSNDGKKTFFGTLVLASLAYKYCILINTLCVCIFEIYLKFIFYNLWKYFLVTLCMLNRQRIHFFLSFNKLRCCTTCTTDMARKCPWALLSLGTFCLFVCLFVLEGGGGEVDKPSNRSCLDCLWWN